MSSPEQGAASGQKKPRSKGCLIALVVLVAGFVYFGAEILLYDAHRVRSVRVLDGYDAVRFELENNDVVSLIGVGMPPATTRDTARNLVQKLIEGKHIRIQTDKQVTSQEKRLLSYVYFKVRGGQQGLDNVLEKMGLAVGKVEVNTEREVFINELLLRLGLAESKPEEPNLKHRLELDIAQEAAQKERLGMWGDSRAGEQ